MAALYPLMLLLIVISAGCGTQKFSADRKVLQEVSGTVLLKPSYDGEDARYIMHPPDTSPRPLPGAVVRLVKYSESAILSKNIAAETHTDEHGKYVLKVATGRYWITVFAPNKPTAIRSLSDPEVTLDFSLNVAKEIELTYGESCIHEFMISELGTM